MLKSVIRRAIRWAVMKFGVGKWLWKKVCNPNTRDYADYLRRHGNFHSIGKDSNINFNATITDPTYVRIGNNVTLSSCTIIGHDGVVGTIGRALGVWTDSVGKCDIRDNVFVGHGAIILPGVTIGPNAVVAAGAIVTRDVPPGSIVAGNPAKVIGTFDALAQKLDERTRSLPWAHIIDKRKSDFDPALEPELLRLRVDYFYNRKGD